MTITPDQIVDRIKLKRQLINWRLIAIIGICMLFVSLFTTSQFESRKPISIEPNYIARIYIDGVIVHDIDRLDILKDIASNTSIKALIVHINSPGGTVVGGESLYNAVRKISLKKPVIAVMGDTAASAAYMTAVACDYLIAHQGTLTGSIGVLAQTFEVTELAHKIGVRFNTFKSSPLKGGPMPTEEVTPEMREAMNATIMDAYQMFFSMVAERRNIPADKLTTIADGRIYTGRQAVENGLIDAIGDEDTAVDWLKSIKKIDNALKVRDVELVPPQSNWRKLLDSSASIMGLLENGFKSGLFSFF